MKTFTQLIPLGLVLAVGLWACQDQVVTPDIQPSFAKPVKPPKPPPDDDPSITLELSTASAVTEGIAFNLQVIASGRKPGVPLKNFNGTVTLSSDGGITPTTVSLTKGVGSVVVTLESAGQQMVTALGRGAAGEWAVDVAPKFFVNGKIAYCSDRGGGGAIWVLEGDDAPRQLTEHRQSVGCGSGLGNWVWSPGGSKLAYTSTHTGIKRIYIINADGNYETEIILPGMEANGVSWSPDGSRIAVMVDRETESEIYVVNSDGSGPLTRLTNNGHRDKHATWSPTRSEIMWWFDSPYSGLGQYGIGIISPDGSNRTNLTIDSQDVEPRWSPDGNKVAFWRRSEDWRYGDFFVMDWDGEQAGPETQLTSDRYYYPGPGATAGYPRLRWSPDGSTIALTHNIDYFGGISEIVLVDMAGESTTLTDAPGHNRLGVWSPSGDWVLFESNRDGASSLVVRNVDDDQVITLTDVLGNDKRPIWAGSG